MNRKAVVGISACIFLVVAVVAAYVLQKKFGYRELQIFPTESYEVYALNDSLANGYSTSEIKKSEDGSVTAFVNIRSGKAYSYAGIGINLRSKNHRPSDYFDFTQYDSIEVNVTTDRMQTIKVRILNYDPVYSQEQNLLSFRPKEIIIPVNAVTKIALADFKTPEWWLAEQGLEEDDYLSYFDHGALLAIVNGEKVLHGIPDEIVLKSVRLWHGNSEKTEEGK